MACVSGTSGPGASAGGGPVEEFIAQARPLIRTEPCLVAGCGRERVTRRGLCRFHGNRLQRQRNLASMSQEELAAWVADEKPRIAAHQFSLAGLPELVRFELLYALQRRDEAPPPLDPLQRRRPPASTPRHRPVCAPT